LFNPDSSGAGGVHRRELSTAKDPRRMNVSEPRIAGIVPIKKAALTSRFLCFGIKTELSF